MKISLFFDNFLPYHEYKDPGQILLGLMESGVDTELITLEKPSLTDYHPKFSVIQKTPNEFNNEKFWINNNSDVIIVYSWLSGAYNSIIQKIKASGKKILVKSDSDGLIGYPLPNRDLRVPLREGGKIALSIALHAYWHRPFKYYHAKSAAQIMSQIELSDGTIIESPEALSNLNYFLAEWRRKDLIGKTHFIPNPVTPEFITSEIGKKENIILSYGRWDDIRQKNTRVMIETAVEFLKEKANFKFIIFGEGTDIIKKLLGDVSENVNERIEILGFVERQRIKYLLSNAKILFVPSRWESFSIASGEALCMGCSVVGTPLESLRYLSMQGFSGTISATFDQKAVLAALIQDSMKWDHSQYDPEEISAFWRTKLKRKNVGECIVGLISKI